MAGKLSQPKVARLQRGRELAARGALKEIPRKPGPPTPRTRAQPPEVRTFRYMDDEWMFMTQSCVR